MVVMMMMMDEPVWMRNMITADFKESLKQVTKTQFCKRSYVPEPNCSSLFSILYPKI
jgi:hypothetical protein